MSLIGLALIVLALIVLFLMRARRGVSEAGKPAPLGNYDGCGDNRSLCSGSCNGSRGFCRSLIIDPRVFTRTHVASVRYWHKADIPSCAAHVRF